jgi:hypothetical protein
VGLQLLKASEQVLTESDVPGWRDHIDVVRKRRSKVAVPQGIEALAQSRSAVALDAQHRALIDVLAASGYACNWIDDHHLLQTHTKALAEVYEKQAIPVKGVFSTLSAGHDPGTPNCFLFPLENGAWKVFRFSQGLTESTTWQHDDWTWCYFNRRPPLKTACLFHGGIEDSDNGEFVFATADAATAAAGSVGQTINVPMTDREVRLGTSKDGRLVVKIARESDDAPLAGWVGKRGRFQQTHGVVIEQQGRNVADFDGTLRNLISVNDENAGWKLKTPNWRDATKDDCRSALVALGVPRGEIEDVIGTAVLNTWKLVNLPFHDEYPGHRQWNYKAAQFAVDPVEGAHPHWDMILRHCGRDLDAYIPNLPWCKEDRIATGADYLTTWLACMFRQPFEPLPYLFMFGEENTGKSIFHEAAALLMTRGVVIADRALTNKNDFNGELANAVLCVVEEKDISKAPGAMNKIKEWVTGKMISIRKMRTDSYSQPNTTHWVQCANDRGNCPVFPGDTRITFICVHHPDRDIPKPKLMAALADEAPAFLHTLLSLELPRNRGRLRLPVITTAHKLSAEEDGANEQNALREFAAERLAKVVGRALAVADVHSEFLTTLPPLERPLWNSTKFGRELTALGFNRQKHGGSQTMHLINVDWSTAA